MKLSKPQESTLMKSIKNHTDEIVAYSLAITRKKDEVARTKIEMENLKARAFDKRKLWRDAKKDLDDMEETKKYHTTQLKKKKEDLVVAAENAFNQCKQWIAEMRKLGMHVEVHKLLGTEPKETPVPSSVIVQILHRLDGPSSPSS